MADTERMTTGKIFHFKKWLGNVPHGLVFELFLVTVKLTRLFNPKHVIRIATWKRLIRMLKYFPTYFSIVGIFIAGNGRQVCSAPKTHHLQGKKEPLLMLFKIN